jgi:PAS domain S-box-containing protein
MRRGGLPEELGLKRAPGAGPASVGADPAALLTCDAERRVTDVSPAALALLGRSRSEVVGGALEDLAPPTARLRPLALLGALTRERPGSWRVVDLASADGGRLPLELACRPLAGGGHLFALRRPAGRAATRPVLRPREREVFARIAEGKTGAEVAGELFLSPATVERHVAGGLRRLGAKNRAHGIAMVLRSGELEGLITGGSGDRASEEAPLGALLEQTLERLEDPVAILGAVGEILFVNAAWRAFGEANGRPRPGPDPGPAPETNYLEACERATGSDDALQAALGIRELLDDHLDHFSLEYRCDAPGEPRWFDLRAARYHGDHRSARVLVRHHDLTPQRRAEGDLRIGASMLDGVQAATLAFSPDGIVTAWARTAESMLGWSAEEAVGRPLWELLLPRRNRVWGEAVAEEARRGGRWSGQVEIERKDGTLFHAHARARALHDADGGVSSMVGVIADLTEQRRAQRATADAEAQLRALAETMRDGWISGDATGRIRHVNATACGVLGWRPEDLVGRSIDEITCVPTPFRPLTRRATGNGPREVHEECLLSAGGEDIPVEYTTTRFATGDVLDQWAMVFRTVGDG